MLDQLLVGLFELVRSFLDRLFQAAGHLLLGPITFGNVPGNLDESVYFTIQVFKRVNRQVDNTLLSVRGLMRVDSLD